MKRWIYRHSKEEIVVTREAQSSGHELHSHTTSQADVELAEKLGISELLLGLLRSRNFETMEDFERYLSPMLRHLAPFCEWTGLEEAARVLDEALQEGRRFAVWGDYDVDGVTSTTVVHNVLSFHGIEITHHLPDRRTEGYGVNVAGIEALAAEGISLLFTVDCGISDVAAVARARELGMIVVISDHHLPPEILPPAHAICNPRLGPCPCPALAGVGTAFFVMAALNARLAARTGKRFDMREVLDVVALGTIADVVDLGGQNRILVKNGLLKIAEARRIGMAALKEVSGYNASAALGAGQIGFGLAPRINAAGRLGEAGIALDLLLTEDHAKARELAEHLDTINAERRAEEERILVAALEQAETQRDRLAFVLHGDDWHPGVIGIVASRIVEKYYRPTLILCAAQSDDAPTLKGSGRSISEFDLHAGLVQCADLLLGFGGHHQAAGMSLLASNLEALRDRFDSVVRQTLGPKPLFPTIKIDAPLNFAQASNQTILKELELLQPFGMGNPEPTFMSPTLIVRSIRHFGRKKEHAELHLYDPSSSITLSAKAWRQAEEFPSSLCDSYVRLAYTPKLDTYSGSASIDLKIKDWKVV